MRDTPLIGRDAEQRRLRAAAARAASGAGTVVVLSGPAGIGKTRLAHDVVAQAAKLGHATLQGRCHPHDDRLSHAPFLDALGGWLRELPEPRRRRLVDGLPDLGRLFDGLSLPPPIPLGDPALDKTRLLEAVARLVERIAERPAVLFLDDLQWADVASLEVLRWIGRRVGRIPLLLVCAFRPEDAPPELDAFVRAARRDGALDEVRLAALPAADVAAVAGAMLGGDPPDGLVRLLGDRAAGVPLFVEAVVRSLCEGGRLTRSGARWVLHGSDPGEVPAAARDVLRERFDQLGPDARHTLAVLAVAGGPVGIGVLLRVGATEDGLVELERRGLAAPAWTIAHPLLQEAAYVELPTVVRQRLHAALADACGDDPERLAWHCRGAGPAIDPVRSVEALRVAGERALDRFAADRATTWFEAALSLGAGDRRALLVALGDARERSGASPVGAWTEALGLPGAEAGLRRRLALAEWNLGHLDAAQAHLRAGLAGARDATELAEVKRAEVVLLGRTGPPERAAAVAGELVELGRTLGSPRIEAEGHLARSAAAWSVGQFEAARAAALACRDSRDPLLELRAEERLALVALARGELPEAIARSEVGLRLAAGLGSVALELGPRIRLAFAAFLAGEWDRAEREVVELTRRIDVPRAVPAAAGMRALLLAWRGDVDGAAACLEGARDTAFRADRNVAFVLESAEVLVALARGDVDGAVLAGRRLDPRVEPAHGPPLGPALLGEALARHGEAAGAAAIAAWLRARDPDGWAGACAARLDGDLAGAVERFDRLGMPFEAARARVLLGEPGPAAEALAVFERLGARRDADQARQVLRAHGVRAPRKGRTRAEGLSARELEVARLVAEGLSNAAIGKRLFISPRTVTTHLDHIYARLGIGSRVALAAWVVERGL